MKEKIIIANWKMNCNPAEASLLVHRLDEKIAANKKVEIVICPPFIDLYPIHKEINKEKFALGAQNIHYLDEGPYTGEISPAMLKGMVSYAIIGHSERRNHYGEDDKVIAKKIAAAYRHTITPILCVGENLMDRQHGSSDKVVTDQLEADLAMSTAEEIEKLIVAYEPVWAIGTGNFAKPDDIDHTIKAIKTSLTGLFGERTSQSVRIVYGGSVEPTNARVYLEMADISGLLIGGASLNYSQFADIIKVAQNL